MNIKKFITIFSLIAALVSIWWLSFQPHQEAKLAPVSPSRSVGAGLEMTPLPTTKIPVETIDTSKGAPTDALTEYMINNYQSSKNYREYIDRVKQHPEKGGLLYAYNAAGLCEKWGNWFGKNEPIPYEANVSHAMAQKKQAALEEVRSRCNGVLPSEFNPVEMAKNPANSPYKQVMTLIRSDDPEKHAEGLKKYMELADPLLVESTLIAILPAKEINPEEKDIEKKITGKYYDGQWYQGEEEKALTQAVVTLLPCYFGWKCDETGLDVLAMCVMSETCPKTRFEGLRDVIFKGDEKKYQQAVAFAESMAKNIREKNIDPFIVKK